MAGSGRCASSKRVLVHGPPSSCSAGTSSSSYQRCQAGSSGARMHLSETISSPVVRGTRRTVVGGL